MVEELYTHITNITPVKVLKVPCWCLQEIPELAGVPAFWVNSAACVDVARNKITHKLAHGELIETEPWLKDGPITIGKAPALMCILTCSRLCYGCHCWLCLCMLRDRAMQALLWPCAMQTWELIIK